MGRQENNLFRGDVMKKKNLIVLGLIILIVAVLLFIVFGVLKCQFKSIESPNGDYEIIGWLVDKGGFGYSGAFYIKEKEVFSKWHKLGTGPFSAEWLSETEFSIQYSYVVDDDNYKVYNVNDFFNQ